MLQEVTTHLHIEEKQMSISTIFTNLFGDSRQNADLKSFAKSEYKNDWEFAYNQLKAGQWPQNRKSWLDER